MDQGFHAYEDKGERKVIMRAVQVCVVRYFWIFVALAEEEELPFCLGDNLAPEAEGEIAGRATEDGDKVAFPELDIFFRNVAPVVVRGNKLVGHAGVCDGGFVFCRRFVVQNLVFGVEARCSHAGYAVFLGGDHGVISADWHWFYPCCVTVYFMEAHLIFVATVGGIGELASLVGVKGLFYVVDLGNEVLVFWFCGGEVPVLGVAARRGGSSGAHALPLAAHVPSLGFFRLREAFVDIFHVYQGPGEKISFPIGLEPIGFGGKPIHSVQVADGGLYAGEFVDVVDCLTQRGAVPHGVYVTAHSADRRDVLERIQGVASIRAV